MNIKPGKQKVNLKELINNKLSEYDIYRHVVGEFRMNMAMKSPLPGHRHGDRSGSFSIGASASGRLIWRDYTLDMKGGAIDLIQAMYGLTYPQALQKVCTDFGLLADDGIQYQKVISSYIQPVIEKHDTIIHVKAGRWTKKALSYWEVYGIGQDQLQQEEIYKVDEWYLNRMKQQIHEGEHVYAYRFEGDLFKIYMPDRTRDEGRWKTNVPCSTVEALDRLNGHPKVILTKSRKDRITLMNLVPKDTWVINSQNEGMSGITPELVERLSGKDVWISFDSDEAGVRNCRKICEQHQYKYVNTPRYLLEKGIKDWSDWYRHEGNNEALKEFLRQKQVI
jgi:hypothetical protein